jgi:hypothetical protein
VKVLTEGTHASNRLQPRNTRDKKQTELFQGIIALSEGMGNDYCDLRCFPEQAVQPTDVAEQRG